MNWHFRRFLQKNREKDGTLSFLIYMQYIVQREYHGDVMRCDVVKGETAMWILNLFSPCSSFFFLQIFLIEKIMT